MRTNLLIGIGLTIMYYLLLVILHRIRNKKLAGKPNEESINPPSMEMTATSSTPIKASSDFGEGINLAKEQAAMAVSPTAEKVEPEILPIEKRKPVKRFSPTPSVSPKSKPAFVDQATVAIPVATKNKVRTMLQEGQDIFQQEKETIITDKEVTTTTASDDLFAGTIFESGISDAELQERRTTLEKDYPAPPNPTQEALLNVGLSGQDLEAITAAAQKVRVADEFNKK